MDERLQDPKISEAHLGEIMMRYLSEQGWDCYPEVHLGSWSARPDIVAVRAGLVMIVELKTQLSFDLLSQALDWLQEAHFVAIGVPKPKIHGGRDSFVQSYLSEKGIGKFEIEPSYGADVDGKYDRKALNLDSSIVWNRIDPKPHRWAHKSAKELLAYLKPDMKVVTPGVQRGFMTEFKRTLRTLEQYVAQHPGCTLKMAIDNMVHHYTSVASAHGSLAGLLHLTELQVVKTGKLIQLYPKSMEIPPPTFQVNPLPIWGEKPMSEFNPADLGRGGLFQDLDCDTA